MNPISNQVPPGPDQVLVAFRWHPNRVPRAHTPLGVGTGPGHPSETRCFFCDLGRSVHTHLEPTAPRPAWTGLSPSETHDAPMDGCFHRRAGPWASPGEIGTSTLGPLRSMGAAAPMVPFITDPILSKTNPRAAHRPDTSPHLGGLHAGNDTRRSQEPSRSHVPI